VIAEQTDDEGDWVAQTCHLCELDFFAAERRYVSKSSTISSSYIVLKFLIPLVEWLCFIFGEQKSRRPLKTRRR